jgi:uncharacterized coiled-coil DUF342 family protein
MMHIDPIIFSILSALATIVGAGVFVGVLKTKVDNNTERAKACATKEELAALAKRADEDRAVNSGQHKEFYSYQNRIVDIEATMKSLKASVDELKSGIKELESDIKSGFREMQNELKGLQRGS